MDGLKWPTGTKIDSLPGIGESHSNRVAAGVADRIGDYLPHAAATTHDNPLSIIHTYTYISSFPIMVRIKSNQSSNSLDG